MGGVSREWLPRATARRAALVCGDVFARYNSIQKTCSKKYCKSAREYVDARENDKELFLSMKLFSTVRMGRGKKEIGYKMVKEALGTECPYCKERLTLYNMSLDHKTPRQNRKVYSRRQKKMLYTQEEIKKLDRVENLHLVCRECNQRKSNFTDEEYRQLLDFLYDKKELSDKLFQRLKLTRVFFGRRGYRS